MVTIRALFSIVVEIGMSVQYHDVKTVFLNSVLDKPASIEVLEGVLMDQNVDPKSVVCELNKTLYGLQRSSKGEKSILI